MNNCIPYSVYSNAQTTPVRIYGEPYAHKIYAVNIFLNIIRRQVISPVAKYHHVLGRGFMILRVILIFINVSQLIYMNVYVKLWWPWKDNDTQFVNCYWFRVRDCCARVWSYLRLISLKSSFLSFLLQGIGQTNLITMNKDFYDLKNLWSRRKKRIHILEDEDALYFWVKLLKKGGGGGKWGGG